MPRLFMICVLLFMFCLSVEARAADLSFAVVDVARVMSESKAGRDGREHIQQVRARLEKGLEELKAAWSKSPAKEREAAVLDGVAKLRRQLAVEETAANNVINRLLLEETASWRKSGKAKIVIARQNVLDCDPSLDITTEIIAAMDKREAIFADLPMVTINRPESKPAKPKPETKKR